MGGLESLTLPDNVTKLIFFLSLGTAITYDVESLRILIKKGSQPRLPLKSKDQ